MLAKLLSRIESLAALIGGIRLMLLLSVTLLLVVATFNPWLLGSYVWAAAKILMAGVIGYALDRAAFAGSDPRLMDAGIEQSMAQSRRGVIIAAAMIAAGLIG